MKLNDYLYVKNSSSNFGNFVESWLHIKGSGNKITIEGSRRSSYSEQVGKLDSFINVIKCISYVLLLPVTCSALIYREVRRNCLIKQIDNTVNNQFIKTFNKKPEKKKQNIPQESPQTLSDSLKSNHVQKTSKPANPFVVNDYRPPQNFEDYNITSHNPVVNAIQSSPKPNLLYNTQVQPIISTQPVLPQGTQTSAPNWIILGGNMITSNSDNEWAQMATETLKQQLPGGKINDQMPTKEDTNAMGIFILHCSARFNHDDKKIATNYAKLKELTGKDPVVLIINLDEANRHFDSKAVSDALGINIQHLFWIDGKTQFGYDAKGKFEFNKCLEQTQLKNVIDSIKNISK